MLNNRHTLDLVKKNPCLLTSQESFEFSFDVGIGIAIGSDAHNAQIGIAEQFLAAVADIQIAHLVLEILVGHSLLEQWFAIHEIVLNTGMSVEHHIVTNTG